ncbi:hypothetical protein LUZ62_067599 [Rhynchospora pubera]|uniref:Uncharacterized protein n=1 Tax=Rhynchospora pubera TaxID=906938 RepID=A0AAV8CR56_9POAL|nr:hypothetical protein LUZ62_067599 [Rhynchospora pubera]
MAQVRTGTGEAASTTIEYLICSTPAPTTYLDQNNGSSWLSALAFAFLTVNSLLAICRSKGDKGTVAFITISFTDLLLLFWCLRLFERAAPGSVTRERIKVAVWSLATLLTLMFSSKVAILMPLPVAVVVWVMAAATSVGGFYAFFLLKE